MNEFFVQLMRNQERLGRRKEKIKHQLTFLLCKHTSFLGCGCFLFPLPALTCNLTAEAISWSMKVSALWPSLSPFPRDNCKLLVLKLRINQPFLVMLLKSCGNYKKIPCRTHSHKHSFPGRLTGCSGRTVSCFLIPVLGRRDKCRHANNIL